MNKTLAAAVAVSALSFAVAGQAAPIAVLKLALPNAHIVLAQAPGNQMSVRVKSAILRAGPDQKSKKVDSLRRGTKLEVLGQSGDWTRVRAGKREGYVSTALLQK
ncbi:MAG: SH3 domain-containing protein [Rhodospirillaceae bacterium]|nr:SH3 domain-containing protein [Rhodospirillaceae bacterium]